MGGYRPCSIRKYAKAFLTGDSSEASRRNMPSGRKDKATYPALTGSWQSY